MLHHSNQVVNFSPENQDSVLGRIVAGESCLELLQNINRVIAYGRAIAEIRAELAAICAARKQPHTERLQAFLTLREDAAKRCREALRLQLPTGVLSNPPELPSETRPD